eukprot:SAG22_NODE_5793_length_951_cov_1.497653_3_plen_74_part_00
MYYDCVLRRCLKLFNAASALSEKRVPAGGFSGAQMEPELKIQPLGAQGEQQKELRFPGARPVHATIPPVFRWW